MSQRFQSAFKNLVTRYQLYAGIGALVAVCALTWGLGVFAFTSGR